MLLVTLASFCDILAGKLLVLLDILFGACSSLSLGLLTGSLVNTVTAPEESRASPPSFDIVDDIFIG